MFNIKSYLITFVILFIFSIIDSSFFLLWEEQYSEELMKYKIFDKNTGPIFLGAMSAGMSMFIATLIKVIFLKNYKLEENPFIDFISIISGAICVIVVYNIYIKYDIYEKHIKDKNNKI
tara:strand:+ start:169 stop:525 length:357 start_codon:yes stop_codon:yes gene_type:complete